MPCRRRKLSAPELSGSAWPLACAFALLSAISWITHLTYPVFSAFGQDFSWRDIILIGGGLFLMVKAIQEVHAEIEGRKEDAGNARLKTSFGAVISQIAVMDLVFSLDSIITAVGLARHIPVMVVAICMVRNAYLGDPCAFDAGSASGGAAAYMLQARLFGVGPIGRMRVCRKGP